MECTTTANTAGRGQGLTSAAGAARNAFVGPRPFPPDRRLYGRGRELLSLTNRLLSERLLLLYSPSGAGKTSLIQAEGGLLERMAAEGFRTLPIVRVSHAADLAAATGVNRYLLSTLDALELARPEAERRTPEALAELLRTGGAGLATDFLDRYLSDLSPAAAATDGSEPPVQTLLVLDQFEELLTLDPTDEPAKREFMRQLGSALRDADRWALFAMREDHVAALDPFLPLIPTRLAATFRLDLLSREAAREAVTGPTREFGVTFDDDAVTALIGDLAWIRVMNPADGKVEPREGPYIEPLHLQVVCESLWRQRAEPSRITSGDIERLAHNQGGSDLRLMSWGGGSGVPTSGNSLVILGTDGSGQLHIRIFDAGGKLVADTDETKLPSTQAAAIAALKQQLPALLPLHVLTDAEKAQVITEATSIVGLTHQGEGVRGVTAALANYYDASVQDTARLPCSKGVTERAIRNWFDRALISPSGLRLPVLFGSEGAYGLTSRVVLELADRYLIRPDQRYGGIYYELAHDRLVEPIRRSNAAWSSAHLTPFQLQATLWDAKGRPKSLLLKDPDLTESQRWATGHPDGTSELDRAYLKESRDNANKIDVAEYTRVKILAIAASITASLAVMATVSAFYYSHHAREQAEMASEAKSRAENAKEKAEKATELAKAAKSELEKEEACTRRACADDGLTANRCGLSGTGS